MKTDRTFHVHCIGGTLTFSDMKTKEVSTIEQLNKEGWIYKGATNVRDLKIDQPVTIAFFEKENVK